MSYSVNGNKMISLVFTRFIFYAWHDKAYSRQKGMKKMVQKWYQQAIIYQIYPRSFQDTNGDGIGDLPGIYRRLPYIKQLGANTIWLNPIFVSPQVDHGYDVANYFAIDPVFGTMADFERLVTRCHELKLRLLLDLPLNHTSDQRPWFQDASQNVNSIYRDYYIWAIGTNGRPNNWGSFFGGSVWAASPLQKDAYYFHAFDAHMPDLNWANPEVRKAMADVAKFWLAKGVAGFRLDAFIHIAKADFNQNNLQPSSQQYPLAAAFYENLPAVRPYLADFITQVKQAYPDTFFLGEAASANATQAAAYTQTATDCDVVMTAKNYGEYYPNCDSQIPEFFQPRQLSLRQLKRTFKHWETVLKWPVLSWGTHDVSRVLDRLQLPKDKPAVAKALALLMYLQKGLPVIYYGEELGLHNLQFGQVADFKDQRGQALIRQLRQQQYPEATLLTLLNQYDEMTARGPFPWSTQRYGGFSTQQPWNWGQVPAENLASQWEKSTSVVQFYRQVLALKQQPLFRAGTYQLLATTETIYAYKRRHQGKTALVVVNFSPSPAQFSLLKQHYRTVLATGAQVAAQQVQLSAWGGIVLITE